MEQGFRVSQDMQEIVLVLKDVLHAAVALVDADTGRVHFSRRNWRWFTIRATGAELEPRGTCMVARQINQRWWLRVSRRASLHPDAALLCEWAAEKLAKRLPARSEVQAYPPRGGGGGSAPPAEVAIPIWWARKVQA